MVTISVLVQRVHAASLRLRVAAHLSAQQRGPLGTWRPRAIVASRGGITLQDARSSRSSTKGSSRRSSDPSRAARRHRSTSAARTRPSPANRWWRSRSTTHRIAASSATRPCTATASGSSRGASAWPWRRRRPSAARSPGRSGSTANGRSLRTLHEAGADVPRAIMRTDRGDPDDLRRRRGRRGAPAACLPTGARRGRRPAPAGRPERRADAVPERDPRRPLRRSTSWCGRGGSWSSISRRRSIRGRTGTRGRCWNATWSASASTSSGSACARRRAARRTTCGPAWQFADLVPEELRGLI